MVEDSVFMVCVRVSSDIVIARLVIVIAGDVFPSLVKNRHPE